MSKIKLVVVPVWLNLIMKELGLSNADLTDWEKLSGIVSSRDLLIYRLVQSHREEILNILLGEGKCTFDFDGVGESLNLEERAFCANVPFETTVFGATTNRQGELHAHVEMIDQNTLGLFLCTQASDKPEQDLKTTRADLSLKISAVLHGMVGVHEMAKTITFQHTVNQL